MAAQQTSTSTSTSGTGTGTASAKVDRTRSVRNGAGTPVSARAAARKPTTSDAEANDDAKAELQAQLSDFQARLAESEAAYTSAQKQGEVLQIKLDEALKEQAILEDNVHEHTERVEELENERREKERGRREMEQIYEAERAANLKEKEQSLQREEELQGSIARMREALQAREIRAGLEDVPYLGERGSRASISRTSSHRLSNSHSPNPPELSPDGAASRQFAPSSLQRSDSRSSSRLVMQKDKIIESLRLELAEAQIKLVELENKGGGHVQLLEKEMYDLKIQNARLMEENESFQLLLQEKTLNGDLLRAPSDDKGSRPSSSRNVDMGGASLADELQDADLDSTTLDGVATAPDSKERRLQGEVNALKDQNKALTLYINNIISRLLQHDAFEAILDKTPDLMAGPGAASVKYQTTAAANTEKELPPPPPLKDDKLLPTPALPPEDGQASGMGFLQRAGSVLKRARPQSIIQGPGQSSLSDSTLHPEPTLHENPSTAPQIPLSRSRSQRAAAQNPHRRSNSDWPAASVVTNMYKGPVATQAGPLSPGLGSPGASGRGNPFFAMSGRQASGGSVPTISETERLDGTEKEMEKENSFPGPVTYLPASRNRDRDRDSVASIPTANQDALNALQAGAPQAGGEVSSNPSSPPRSTTSSGERDAQAPKGGSVMMGSKPRPLRLVQEASAEDERARNKANRGSWFGWAETKVKNLTATGTTPPTAGMSAYMPGRLGSQDGRAGSQDGRMPSHDGSQGGQ